MKDQLPDPLDRSDTSASRETPVYDGRAARRLRVAYELGRARRALLWGSPALLFVLGSALGGAPASTLALGGLLYATAVLALVLGGSAAAAVAPSLVVGAVPFLVVRLAESTGHVCLGDACVSWCLPACALGGTLGGVLVGVRGARVADRTSFWLTAMTLVFLAGALGCRCSGTAGLGAIAAGVLVGALGPLALRPVRAQ